MPDFTGSDAPGRSMKACYTELINTTSESEADACHC